ncbi:HAD-IA family hydrolase [Candidatus Daviesbacteria bacterium]|nr:HAD-IA family hydrolase [Candidatus Daviesbacteria bacterium]
MIKALLVDFFNVLLVSDNKLFSNYQLNQELLAYLKNLKSKYKLYIFTSSNLNNDLEMKAKLEAIFEKIYTVSEIGSPKDQTKAYQFILKDLNLKPDEVLFIDDGLDYVQTAQELGLKALQFITNQKLFNNLEEILNEK